MCSNLNFVSGQIFPKIDYVEEKAVDLNIHSISTQQELAHLHSIFIFLACDVTLKYIKYVLLRFQFISPHGPQTLRLVTTT